MWERKATVLWRGGSPFCGEKTEKERGGERAECQFHTRRTLPQNIDWGMKRNGLLQVFAYSGAQILRF